MAESYRRWRLPELWEMVAADNAADAHLHLATLRRQQTALETQRDRLRVLRDQLAEAWPPDKSDAATMFLQRLNDMIDAFAATARGAAEVRIGVEIVADAIGHAREQLAPLVERYAKAQLAPDPRVGRQAQKLLDQEGRRILVAADVTVRDATSKFATALPDYARISMRTSIPAVNGGTNSTSGAGADGGGTNGASTRLSGFAPPQFDPPAPVAGESIGEDVLLAGGRSDTGIGGWGPGEHGVGQTGGGTATRYQEPVAGVGRVLGIGTSNARTVTGVDGMARGVGPQAMRGVPGGVIGGPPVAVSAGSARGRSVPPVTASRSTPSTSRPIAGGYQDRSFEEYVARRREPDDDPGEQWTVIHGVRPLLEALPPVRTHDPGPGVIGLDR
ncbi:hypothetical protein AB0K00_23110 [Dactylosporangium sp. NPDC049525]|uniref:hypothetical protein n=1 Tax=Dactylosporangium sp. NPDC049525 TaxID=3154730 RepID=UPI003416998B